MPSRRDEIRARLARGREPEPPSVFGRLRAAQDELEAATAAWRRAVGSGEHAPAPEPESPRRTLERRLFEGVTEREADA